jgi:predicted transcriptional regulator
LLESEVMGVLWAHDGPVTASAVQGEIGGGLAYNTVQTILIRLYEKGQVERRRDGRGHVYWPAQDAASAAAAQMRAALAGRADRQAVLRQFAATLDDADAEALRALLSEPEG